MSTLAVDSITDAVGSGAPAFPNGVSGNIVSTGALTATGIYLGGTGSANLLDDYEEGTWTPTIYGVTTAGTTTYFQQAATYTKVGRLVTVQIFLNITGQTGAGTMRLGGLPFTAGSGANTFPCSVAADSIALSAGRFPVFSVQGGSTYINMFETATGGGALYGIPIDTSFAVDVTATYFTA